MIAGFAVFGKIKSKFDFSKYKNINVIITHLHNDHAGSLSQFILYCWFVYHKKVTVISKCKNIQIYLDITGTTKEAYNIREFDENLEFIKTEHAKELDAYGFSMYVGDKHIVYTGDTSVIYPFKDYLTNCDEFYVDVSKNGGVHLKFEDIIDELRKIKCNGTKVILMHVDDKDYIEKLNNNEFYI